MKTILLVFEDDEFEKLVKLKDLKKRNWHDFILEIAGFKLKEARTNGFIR